MASIALGVILALIFTHSYENKLAGLTDKAPINISGIITSKEVKNDKLSLVLSQNKTGSDLLIVSDDLSVEDELKLHSHISVTGTISLFSPARNPGEFNSLEYYRSRGIICKIYASEIQMISDALLPISESLYQLRKKIVNVFSKALESDEAAILSSIATGDRTALTSDIKELFKSGGISHILCVSGMHISLLGSIILWLLSRLKINRHIALVVACIITFFYALLCGMSVSTIRALLTFFVQALAFFLKRQYDRLSTLSLIMITMLITNPLLCQNSGFIFSFWSVFSFTVISEADTKNKIIDAILLQLFSMPIVALYYYELPLFSFAINLLLVPYLGVVLMLGILGGLVGVIFPGAEEIVLFPCHIVLRAYIFVCDLVNKLPLSTITTGAPSPIKLIIYFVLLFGLIILIQHKPKLNRLAPVIGLFVFTIFLSVSPNPRSVITFLDVGQGDGIFIADSCGTTYFVDGGSTSKKEIGQYTLLPFLKYNGIKNIDYWIVSHGDSDHVNGLIELLEKNYPISHIVIADNSPAADNISRITALSHDKNIPLIKAHKGNTLHAKKDGASLLFLWPSSDEVFEDINSASLVFTYEDNGFSAIFTGDISSEDEKKIVSSLASKRTLDIDLLKVAHHGSKYSGSDDFLSVTSPKTAVISCGIGNIYHHPHSESLYALKKHSCQIFRTDYSGAITINYNSKGYSTQKFLPDHSPE